MSDQVRHLQSRVGQLQDRVATLENRLDDTREKIQHDVKRLADILIEVQKQQTRAAR